MLLLTLDFFWSNLSDVRGLEYFSDVFLPSCSGYMETHLLKSFFKKGPYELRAIYAPLRKLNELGC